jgi:2-oxoglutarate ferredoxin oxidoreductase subunit beta
MHYPEMPEPMGVFRAVQKPAYEELMLGQLAAAREKKGPGKLDKLFTAGDTWKVA